MRKPIAMIMALLMIMMILAACGGTKDPNPQPGQQNPNGGSTGGAVFHGAFPYQLPPTGHYNTYLTNNLLLGIYGDLMQMPLGMYYWGNDTWMPLMGTSWEFQGDDFIVKLRQGAKWSDGTEFTSADVVDTFTVGNFLNWIVFRYVGSVEAIDKHTVAFKMKEPSSVVPRYVLKERIRPSSQYGEWAKKIADVMAKDPERKSDDYKNLRAEFEKYRPETMVVSGPFEIDKNSFTEAQVQLQKVPTAWNADVVQIDRIVLYNGETPTVTPLVLAKQVDYATHGFPVATAKQFIDQGLKVYRPPTHGGGALYMNHTIYPLNRVEVRQAMAYAINREENAKVTYDESGKAPQAMSGMSDLMVPLWLSDEAVAKLNTYEYNPTKAAELLTSIGFKKGSDGIWVDDKGKKMEFDLLHAAEYADTAASAENAATQLTKFGIKVSIRTITFTQIVAELTAGRYQMAISGWGAANPHPHFAYTVPLFTYNIQADGGGMQFEMNQTTKSVGEVDFEKLVVDSAKGLDTATQKAGIEKIALAFNELLPVIPLYERYGNNPVLDGDRVTGWGTDKDLVWQNSYYSDNPPVMLILEGKLKGK